LRLEAVDRRSLDAIGVLINSPAKEAADMSQQIVRLVGRTAGDRLDDLDHVARADLGDRALAQDGDEHAPKILLDLPSLALARQLLANEIFSNRRERVGPLALLGQALPLDLSRRIDAALNKLEPFARPIASLFKCDLAVSAERAARRVAAARIAGDEHKRLGTLIGDAHAEPWHERVENLHALTWLCRLERLDDPIIESPLGHVPLRDNIRATDMPELGCCPMKPEWYIEGGQKQVKSGVTHQTALWSVTG